MVTVEATYETMVLNINNAKNKSNLIRKWNIYQDLRSKIRQNKKNNNLDKKKDQKD